MGQTIHQYLIFETKSGFCGIAWNSVGITRFQLPTRDAKATERILLRRLPGAEPGIPTPEVAKAIADVQRYFEGEKVEFTDLPVDLGHQDEFFQRVYAAVRSLGWGETTTYGTLAKELGAGREAARDVGQAMAQNPVPLIIPCHRVLAAGRIRREGAHAGAGGRPCRTAGTGAAIVGTIGATPRGCRPGMAITHL
jgi:methylated-DNA-[protein]-cysteine S-methyltransferase